MTFYPPMGVGDRSSQSVHAADLGKVYLVNGKFYRLVKAVSTIAAPGKIVFTTAVTAGQPTWSVDQTTTQNDYKIACVADPAQVALTAGDYFLGQTSGTAACLTSDQAAVAGDPIGTATVAGRVQGTATATSLVATTSAFTLATRLGVLLVAATAASATVYVRIDRLL